MEISTSKLDEVQIIAYGSNSQRFQTGNVASVKAVDIEKQPVNNLLLALQGRVPGLFITQANGLSGGGINVTIQGQNSIRNGTAPLYVVDGVPFPSELPPGTNYGPLGNSGGKANERIIGSGNALSYISPSDIESIDILKDADATAIYGSRAANGAVLITTKKAKQGKASLDVKFQHGEAKVTGKIKMLNTQQYVEMRKEALINDGFTPDADNAPDLFMWDTTRHTDWQKTLIGNTARFDNVNASLSGGNNITQYIIRGTYQRETTVIPGDFKDQKKSMFFNINNNLLNHKLNFQLSGTYLLDNNRLPADDPTSLAIAIAPNAPLPYNSDGKINWMPNAWGSATWQNPFANLNEIYQVRTTNLIANATFCYRILPGLEIKSSIGYNNITSNDFRLKPQDAIRPEYRSFMKRSATYGNKNLNSWIIEPQLSYEKRQSLGRLICF